MKDYTLVDTRVLLDSSRLASESVRPGLHDVSGKDSRHNSAPLTTPPAQFLAAVYPYFDICVWSQTSWRWLEAKLTELNMLSDSRCESRSSSLRDR